MVERSIPELLGQSPDQAVIGVTRSPEGELCVGMALNGKMWIHLQNFGGPMASRLRTQLADEFDTDTVVGSPIDVDESLASGNVELLATVELEKGQPGPVVGVFVEAGKYTHIADFLFPNRK